ncbi:MAG: response regulator transcription factor [Anaerolineales bacterium]|jgi:two-component system KDP operon response regulator KdpE
MKSINVLVVDDEKSLRDFIQRNLEIRGYRVWTAGNGLEALAIFDQEYINLVILDVMMPNMDGLEALRKVREKSTVPVIVLSALGEERDKVTALNLGADDYLTKPFGVNELLARVRAVQRRMEWGDSGETADRLVYGDISIDIENHTLLVAGKALEVTPTEFNLLVLLMRNAGKVLTHQMILKKVWGPEYGQEAEYLRVYVGRLRQKIEKDPSQPQHLITEHGIGYRFVG